MSAFDRLIAQIDFFIRKFYKNLLVKGLFLFVAIFLITYLTIICLEYFGRFNSFIRAAMFFSFIALNTYVFIVYILNPTLKLRAFGKRIDRYQASVIIGRFFPSVSDRLLNTLQLKDKMDPNAADYELLLASVQQRSESMSTVPFAEAIDISENKKYVVWVAPVLMLMFAIGIFAPSMYQQGTQRVVHFTEDFPIPAPFDFELTTTNTDVEEGDDVLVAVKITGNELPEKVYVRSDLGYFLMKRTAKNKHEFTISQVKSNLKLVFEAEHDGRKIKSREYLVEVDAKTAIGKLQAVLRYPKYLDKADETIDNASNLTIPEGTNVTWNVLTKNSKATTFIINKKELRFQEDGFRVNETFGDSGSGKIVLKNRQNNRTDTTVFVVDVIKDAFPEIRVEEDLDSLKDGLRFFSGVIGDDHGLAALTFHYSIISETGNTRTQKMNVARVSGTESPFNFAVDFRREELNLKDRIEYYFVVTDNDGVNGGKSTKSRMFTYTLPTLEELLEERTEEQKQAESRLENLLQQADDFEHNLDRLKKEINNSSKSDWNKSNQLEQLKEQHESILENLEQLKEEMNTSLEEKNQLSEMDKELMEKAALLEELLEQLMDDELKDLLDKLEELLKEKNNDALEQRMDELELSSEEMKNQLDRSLEMLKKMHLDEKIDDLEKSLEELAKEQDALRKEMEAKKDSSEEDLKEQKEIEKKFDALQEKLNDIDSLNKEMERPMDLGDPEKIAQDIEEQLQQAGENMGKGKQGKASENQKSAAEKMRQMAEDMNQSQQESQQQQQEEDVAMLRNILESLVLLSFDQERVMTKLDKTRDEDPAYLKYGREQRRIIDDTKIVKDSLYALAKRQPMIATFIDEELSQIRVNHEMSIEDIDERRRRELTIHQQYAMTSYNNLALMLNESLEQMQKQLQNMMPGKGACNKPGGKGVPKPGEGMNPGNMKEMLKKQLEQMEKGSQPGGKKPGEKPGQGGQGGMMGLGNQQIAKMAAEQGAIRRRLEQLKNELNKDGSGKGNQLNPLLQELEKQERDLVNKRLDDNLIKRQRDILTRLLESEKAMMERGLDEKRESKEGKNDYLGNKIRFDQYNKEKLKQIELLRAVDPSYKKYYKDRANEYFNRIN